MASAPPGSTPDEALARLVLPEVDDLLGSDWEPESDDGSDADDGGGGLASLADACLPDGFPDREVVALAEVSFTRPGSAVVLAMASVFRARPPALAAWQALRDRRFVECFASSIADDVGTGGAVELLGPAMDHGPLVVERGGVRTDQQRAAFSGASDEGLRPAVLHLSVTVAGRAVVLVWGVDRGDAADEAAWEHLVGRVELRCEAALAEPSGGTGG